MGAAEVEKVLVQAVVFAKTSQYRSTREYDYKLTFSSLGPL